MIIKLRRICLRVIQVYAPTSTYADEDAEAFYKEIKIALFVRETRLKLP